MKLVHSLICRYQYMSLVDFLSQMRYQAPYGEAPGSPSMSMYWEWGSWSDFYQGSQQKLAQAVDATALEACRCHRSDTPQTFTQEHQAGRIKEDREFILAASPINETDRYKFCTPDTAGFQLLSFLSLFSQTRLSPMRLLIAFAATIRQGVAPQK